ncbi:MAG TPA: S8 family serine peptidase [Blastocatellia bacterium]
MKLWLLTICLLLVATPLASISGQPGLAAALQQSEPKELEAFQAYLDPAPLGMDVRHMWGIPGGRGENVRIVDIEYNWNTRHNDLLDATANLLIHVRGIDAPDTRLNQANIDHGTAVIGILSAAPDDIGITGICHRARLGLVNPLTSGEEPDVAAAIRQATAVMEAGDVMVLEQQSVKGPKFDPLTGRGLLPIEYESDIYRAIKDATAKGIVVVESAGNGFDNLDDPLYNGAFNRNVKDSGAIMVGAGLPEGGIYGNGPDRSRTPESNYGSRVDVQGWGRFVTTTGYGGLRQEQGENNWYTIDFGATSAATAMVAGAAAILQSIIIERGQPPLSPIELRRLLSSTGTPQTGNLNERIGPRPNLRAALEELDADPLAREPRITSVKVKGSGGKIVVNGENFITDDSIIEIGDVAITRLKFPSAYRLPNGLTTRIMSKDSVSDLVPRGAEVTITVFNQRTGIRSEPFVFRRK